MIKLYALMSVISFALLVFCVIDIIGTPAHRIRNLPKIAGCSWSCSSRCSARSRGSRPAVPRRPPGEPRPRAGDAEYPEYDRPGRAAAADPEKDEEFLRQVRERAEEQRKRYQASRKPEPTAEPVEQLVAQAQTVGDIAVDRPVGRGRGVVAGVR